jgi:uncharacterized LabA/DUF88 family protein
MFSYGPACFPPSINKRRFGWNPELLLFWDCMFLHGLGLGDRAADCVSRVVYVTSSAGDDNKLHDARVAIRGIGFEPIVVDEQKQLHRQREVVREKDSRIDKPKGCDIALVTRMVADAGADLYDRCCLFTSDADYLPAIEAVRRMGKTVVVGGYASVLPARSPYLYVPDKFVDLEKHLKNECTNWRGKIDEALAKLDVNNATK